MDTCGSSTFYALVAGLCFVVGAFLPRVLEVVDIWITNYRDRSS